MSLGDIGQHSIIMRKGALCSLAIIFLGEVACCLCWVMLEWCECVWIGDGSSLWRCCLAIGG